MNSVIREQDNVKISVGDKVKSFSFEPMEGRPDRYVVGRVERIENGLLIINEIESDMDFPEDPREEVQTAVDSFFGEYDGRIIVIG